MIDFMPLFSRSCVMAIGMRRAGGVTSAATELSKLRGRRNSRRATRILIEYLRASWISTVTHRRGLCSPVMLC